LKRIIKRSKINKIKKREIDPEVDEETMRQTKNEMFDHYKKNRNLNHYYYLYDDPGWRKDIEDLCKEFYESLNQKSVNRFATEEDKVEEQINLHVPKNTVIKPKNRKHTETSNPGKSSFNFYFKEKKKSYFTKDCLDLDDLVKVEMPEEYNEEKHENLIMSLAEDLTRARKKVLLPREKQEDIYMKNDDFNLLLCLLRKKKEKLYEKNPYNVDYDFTLEDVYTNELQQELKLKNFENSESNQYIDNKLDVKNFVKRYIENAGTANN